MFDEKCTHALFQVIRVDGCIIAEINSSEKMLKAVISLGYQTVAGTFVS